MVDEKFYGEALREAESGVRRDGIWAKALTVSNGDTDRIRSNYIELLAQHLSKIQRQEERTAYWADVKVRCQKVVILTTGALIFLAVATTICNIQYKQFEKQWLINYGETLQAQDHHELRRLFDKNRNMYMEPTTREMWDVELASSGLTSPQNLNPLQMDLYRMSPSDLYFKYGNSAETLIALSANIGTLMSRARPPSMWHAILSGFRVR